MATVMLALMILAINYAVAMLIAPQYAIFGTQTFCIDESGVCKRNSSLIHPCSESFKYSHAKDVCTPSIMSTVLNRITITWPFFGAVDFWAQFAFLGVFLVVLVTALIRTPRVNMAEIDEDAEEDEEESLLASTGRRFGATWQDIRGKVGNGGEGRVGESSNNV